MERREVERRLGQEVPRILAETTAVPVMDDGRVDGPRPDPHSREQPAHRRGPAGRRRADRGQRHGRGQPGHPDGLVSQAAERDASCRPWSSATASPCASASPCGSRPPSPAARPLLASRPMRCRPLAALGLALLLAAHPRPGRGLGLHRPPAREPPGDRSRCPPPLRELLRGNADYLAEHAIDPDLWRGAGQRGRRAQPLPRPGRLRRVALRGHLAGRRRSTWPRFGAEAPRAGPGALARRPRSTRAGGRVPGRRHRPGPGARRRSSATTWATPTCRSTPSSTTTASSRGQTGFHARWESEMVDRFVRQLEPAVQPSAAHGGEEPVGLVFDGARGVVRRGRRGLALRPRQRGPTRLRRDARGRPLRRRLLLAALRARGPAARAPGSPAPPSAWARCGSPPGRRRAGPRSTRRSASPTCAGQTRLILVSLDGSAAPVVHDAVARGVMPQPRARCATRALRPAAPDVAARQDRRGPRHALHGRLARPPRGRRQQGGAARGLGARAPFRAIAARRSWPSRSG